MSSDGSVSSRISQFGLYRTIDARTEEFLKLSKKRQIKQGCVCAAISTAITVTIVVTVLLVYEYNIIAEARKTNHKANWLGLMNNSVDDPNLLEILNKEKIDMDKATLKLLPILLKALKQNVYLEKIIEEPTSPFTPYDKEATTETAFTKNIFADTRNWMKSPHSRLYTIEYKTSPIVYFKNPTRNIDYFTKIRKIRDYQRILNYVDKMISDKNSLGTTQPMRRDYGHTEKPYKITTPIAPTPKHRSTQKIINKQNTSIISKIKGKSNHCKCSHKLSEVMHKLLSNMQQLMSYFSGSNSKKIIWCENNNPIQIVPKKSPDDDTNMKNIHKVITENHNFLEPKLIKKSPYITFLNRHKYNIDYTPTKSVDVRKDYTVNAIMNLIKPNFKKHNDVNINFESNEAFSTTNTYVTSNNDIFKESTSKSYTSHIDHNNKETQTTPVTTLADYLLQKGTYDISPEIRSSLSTFPESDFNDDEDYAEAIESTTNLANNFNKLDTYSLALVKNNLILGRKNVSKETKSLISGIKNVSKETKSLISVRKNASKETKSYPFKGTRFINNVYNNIVSMRKMGNLVPKLKGNSLFFPNQRRFNPITKQDLKSISTQTTSIPKYKSNIIYTTISHEKTSTIKNIFDQKYEIPIDIKPKQNHTNNITSTEKNEKMWDENVSKEITLKHIEEAIMILNNETTTNQVEKYNDIATDNYQMETAKLEEHDSSTKSLKPLRRTTYLEMQRNDWKHDENPDFDNDINYIFD